MVRGRGEPPEGAISRHRQQDPLQEAGQKRDIGRVQGLQDGPQERDDHSVIAALQLKKRHLHLVHMHRFPLGTGLASVIGYVKILRDRWHRIIAAYVDITKHKRVSPTEILSEEERERIIKFYHVEPYQFPWIKVSDPVSIILGAKSGDILRKSGYSETAGTFVSYRYVV